jgi:hypothetical protein
MGKSSDENLKRLRDALDAARMHLQWPSVSLKHFWARVREVNDLIKTLRPVPTDERNKTRSELDAMCQRARDLRKSLDDESRIKRELVESKIAEARLRTKGDASDLRKARELQNEALEWMKNGWSGFNATTQLTSFSSGKMNRQDHDLCWKQWQEVNDAINWKYHQLRDLNHDMFRREAFEASANAETDPKLAKEQVKAIQRKMPGTFMSKEQFDDIRSILDDVWNRANRTNRRAWSERKLGQIARKRELIERAEDLVARLEAQIENCREMEANARTEDHAEMVRGWIEEKYEIIESKHRFIEDLKQQIREIEGQLG